MIGTDALSRGRAAYERRVWSEAYAALKAADGETRLEPEDLERLAISAYLAGDDAESARLLERAYAELLNGGQTRRAAGCAFWLGFMLLNLGEQARAGGWQARAQRLLDDHHPGDSLERGYMLLLGAERSVMAGDAGAAQAGFSEATEIGERFRDQDLVGLGRLGQGQAAMMLGEVDRSVALFDEIMVAATAGELSPIVAGIAYCAAISASQETFDLRRAQEWTAALSNWCASQPGLVAYRGQCLVHRAEILQMHGAWPDAMDEAQRACEALARQPAVGDASYALAELHRLRGEFGQAEDAYRQASQWGREPQPGLARLRLAQGRPEAAAAALRRLLDEAHGWSARARALAAYVETMLALSNVSAARAAADELAAVAAEGDVALLRAMASHAQGWVLLIEGDPRQGLAALRHAWRAWQELDVPYEAARVRTLVGLACRDLGDEDTAQMEFDAARLVFDELGASTDLTQVDRLAFGSAPLAAGALSPREVQVLRLVATGKTNRAIASDLFLSEKTVARHLSNIFAKLGVSSRSAATAYAYEQGLA